MTNNLGWTEMKRPPLHSMKMWLASYRNTISFVISLDEYTDEPEYMGYVASYRYMMDNSRPVRIGSPYASLEAAQEACSNIIDKLRH